MITITLAPCLGVDKPFAAVAKETVALVGTDVPDGLQVALFDGSGTCLAIADIKDAQAELDLDTQQAVDATTPAAPGEAVTAWLVVGDKDTHIATLPCKLIRNLIDDGAVHPSVPAERYPTVDELAKWLEEAGVIAGKVTTGATRAEQAAQNASAAAEIAQSSSQTAQRRAQEATSAKNAAAESASRASQSANSAGQFSSRASDHANKAKRSASDAENFAMQAQGAKGDASRFAQQAGGAKDDALAAKLAAETAADNAQTSAQEAAAKADEANQAAADASSASTSAEAAKTAAETAKTQAEAARDNANAAKTAAEKAKQDAEAAQAAASTSASQAATSATNAAASATAAKEAAEGLKEGLATLDGLDGRVTLLETGEGVYKDPKTGKVKTFTPFEKCADGTLQVLGDGGFFKRVAPVEVGATEVCSPIGDGTFLGFVKGGGDYWADTQVFGYNGAFKRIFRVKIRGEGMTFSDQGYRCANAQFAVWTGADGVRRAACPDKGGNRLYLFEMPDAELVTQYVKSVAAPTGWFAATVWYNEQSGHLNALCKTDAEGFFVVAWDTELNPILGEDGAQRHVPAPDWATYNHGYGSPNVIRTYGRTFVWDTGWSAWGGGNSNFALFASTAEDGLEPVHEHIPLPDPDAPSICKRTVDAEGNIVVDDPSVNATRPRLETEDVGVLMFCAKQPERRKLPSGATNGPPAFALSSGIVLFSDGVNVYWLTKDGRFINASYCSLNQTAQPGYNGNNPTPVTAPWPPAYSGFPVVAVGVGAGCNALVYAKTAEWSTFKYAFQSVGQQYAAYAKLTKWKPDPFFSVAPVTSGANVARLGALFGGKYAYYVDYDYLAQSGGTMGGTVL